MNSALGLWMEENADLFRYVADLPSLCEKCDRILLSGGASSLLAGVFSSLFPDSEIVAVDSNESILTDAQSECPDLDIVVEPFEKYISEKPFDIIVSALSLQSLDTRELTPYLFSLYDTLEPGGAMLISFPDAVTPTVMEKNLYPSWYSMDENVYMKYYMAGDVVNALSLIGFEIKAIEADNNDDLMHVVTVLCTKKIPLY